MSISRSNCLTCPHRQAGVLSGSSDECAQRFSESLTRFQLRGEGTPLFHQGQPVTSVYFLCRGTMKLFRTDVNGEQVIIDIVLPCSVLGQFPDGEKTLHSYAAASACDEVEVACLSKDELLRLLRASPDLASNFLLHCSKRLTRVYKLVSTMSLKVTERLLAILTLFGYLTDPETSHKNKAVEIPLSHGQLAELIQTTPETLSRVLHELEKKKILQLRGSKIRSVNPGAIAAYIEE